MLSVYNIHQAVTVIKQLLNSHIVPLFLTVIRGYIGFQVGFRRREEFSSLINLNRKEKEKRKPIEESAQLVEGPKPKILDTSVIIDGRIADICQTSFLEGNIVIPQFVLGEIHHIVDSSDEI